MDYTEAEQAIIAAIEAIPGAPAIAFPDSAGAVDLPRWVIQTATNTSRVLTTDGAGRGNTEILVRVETVDGDYAQENTKYLSMLLEAFPAYRRITSYSGAEVMIAKAPEPRPPLIGGGVYARPVYIKGVFFI